MHSEYLRRLFLEDALAEGHYVYDGETVALSDIRVPIFAVATTWDHVAPWRSVYKINLQTDAEVTFLLTEGGHNAGIVSPPGDPPRRYQLATRAHGAPFVDPARWVTETPAQQGSWWPAWQAWVARRSGALTTPPSLGAPGYEPLTEAPGTYVAQR
jgi:polyhydroxyalkanoate synthase